MLDNTLLETVEEIVEKADLSPQSRSDTLFESGVLLARPLVLTPLGQAMLWEKMSRFPILFASAKETTFDAFKDIIDSPMTILVGFHEGKNSELLGLGMVRDIVPGVEAKLQLSFFDQILKGREDFIRRFIKWIADTFLVRRVAADIRADARAMRAFLERVGLYFEGVKKNWIRKGHRFYDLYQFAICDFELDEHWMEGRTWAKPRVRLLEIYEVR